MSKATWEEEIEDKLNQILQEIKVTQDMIGNCMTDVKIPPKKPTRVQAPITNEPTSGLVSGGFLKKLEGVLVDSPSIREVTTRNGPSEICNFTISTEEYGEVRIGLWEEMGRDAKRTLNPGNKVVLTALSIKDEYNGVPQLSGTRNTKISIE